MGLSNLTLRTIIYPQIHASKTLKNACNDEGKRNTLLFLLQGGGWGELTNSEWPHVCLCTLKWGRHTSKDEPHSPPGPAPDPSQSEGRVTRLLPWAAESPSSGSQASPSQLLLPGPWATQEGQCSCNFLISVYNPRVENACNRWPRVLGYMQRQVSISLFSAVGIFPVSAPLLHARQGLQLAINCRAGSLEPCME